jgi:hypothetical protein
VLQDSSSVTKNKAGLEDGGVFVEEAGQLLVESGSTVTENTP